MSGQIYPTPAGMPQCRVCLDEFQASGPKKPKVLPCQHTFCRECLRSLEIDGRIECPLCREICRKAIEELPNNISRLRLNDLNRTLWPNASDEPTSPTPAVDDMVLAIRTCHKDPDKVLSQLKAFRHARKNVHFQAEHAMIVMICMEQYTESPLQQPDIIIVCIQIVHDMVSCGLGTCMSFAVKEKLHEDIFDVLTASKTIRSALRSPCLDILYYLSQDEVQKTFNSANASVLFQFMEEPPAQSQDDAKLIFVLLQFLEAADVAAKEYVGTRGNVKIVLGRIITNAYKDDLYIFVGVLVSLTDLAALPCKHVVSEGGLSIIKRLLEEQAHQHNVIASAMILLCNISDVPDLRKDIIKNTSLIELAVSLLHSDSARASIVSALIITNLSFVQASEWLELCGTNDIRTAALTMLEDIVPLWIADDPLPGDTPFGLDSFKPLFPVLRLYSIPPCQLFAAWMLRKFCTDGQERYRNLLIKEDGMSILFGIKENDSSDETLRKVVEDILLSIS